MKKITKIEKKKSISTIKVAAYIRVSTSSESQEESFLNQKEHFEKLILQHDHWELVEIYADKGISATGIKKREGLQKLIRDCQNAKIDFIITKSISRLARNTKDCLSIVRQLLDLGVNIYFEKENINTQSMDGELMLTILSSLAEDESRSHSKNIEWAIKKRFETGAYIISTPPFGYKKLKDLIVVDQEEAEYVKLIYKLYLEGKGSWSISKYLNKYHPNENRGKNWKERTIGEILKNISYTGDLILQKTYTVEYKSKMNSGEKNQYLIEDNHESIISKEDFEKVQKLIILNSHSRGNNSGEKYRRRYEFSGKIKCSNCDNPFKRRHYYNPNQIVWTCTGRLKEKESCDMKFIKDEDLKKTCIKLINKLIYSRNVLLKSLYKNISRETSSDLIENIEKKERKIQDLKEEEKVLINLQDKSIIDYQYFRRETETIEQKLKELNREKISIKERIGRKIEREEELEQLLKFTNKKEYLKTYDKEIVERFIEKIQVIDRETLEFQFKCGLKIKEIIC